MRVLLLGEYSNVHATLSAGLKALGHEVVVASNGDFWKNYPRDISLVRTYGWRGGIGYVGRLLRILPQLRGFDVVQLINPMFLELKAEHILPIYKYLRRHNKAMVLGAFGMDHYWVHTCTTLMPLRYSDFNIGHQLRTNHDALKEQKEWTGGTAKEKLNKYIAHDADAIVAGLYEYLAAYKPHFGEKTSFIPFPIVCPTHSTPLTTCQPLRIFIGINKTRSAYKGTDVMLRVAEEVAQAFPKQSVQLLKAVSLPFSTYQKMMDGCHVMLDQLYSYTPSMNSLLAMSKGIVVVGGGEPENYEILGEDSLRPIVNVTPDEESVRQQLINLVEHPQQVLSLSRQSIDYVRKHHDHIRVAQQYLRLYKSLL